MINTSIKYVLFISKMFVQPNSGSGPLTIKQTARQTPNAERLVPLLDRSHREAANELAGHDDAENNDR